VGTVTYKVAVIKKIMHVSEYCKFGPRINTCQVVSFAGVLSYSSVEAGLEGPISERML